MKNFIKEFKEFALKGNVMDLAVGVIIGGAFSSLVTSLIDNIISPIIGCFSTGGFNGLHITIGKANIYYGAFIMDIINFLIMALVIFIIVKGINKLTSIGKKKEEEAPTTKTCKYCQSEISINAIKCPNCTSMLDTSDIKK
ncbi:large conductance mechanosensitive channel [Lachnospiraceae bacterium RM5]|nr:large conductance mechanosensitive channel [Lachnospiraceae bacterium RM5]